MNSNNFIKKCKKTAFDTKKHLTRKKILIVVAILAIISVPIYQKHIKNSRNTAARKMLEQIDLAQIAMQPECMPPPCPYDPYSYAFTDGASQTAEASVAKLVKYWFRPDPSVAFHIVPPPVIDGVTPEGFIAFAAHNSVGSTVYVYDNVAGGGIKEARENDVYSGISVNNAKAALFCYKYDPSNTGIPVEKKSNYTKIASDPNDVYPARMVVTAVAD